MTTPSNRSLSADPSATVAAAGGARRASRPGEGAIIGGVAAGLAEHLGVDVLLVRIVLVLLSFCAGLGLLLYAGLWMTLPVDRHFDQSAPGIESATRAGWRTRRSVTHSITWSDAGPMVSVGAVMVGFIALFGGLFTRAGWVWPALLVLAGVAMLWWQADQAQRERWWDQRDRNDGDRARQFVRVGGNRHLRIGRKMRCGAAPRR